MNKITLTFFAIISFLSIYSQDTLPHFTLRNLGNNRVVIDWINNFETVKQISIQRSFDSLKNFKTILTVPDPGIPQNGFADTKGQGNSMYYRLYILLDKGAFLFSEAKRPVWDTVVKREVSSMANPNLTIPSLSNGAVAGPTVSGNNNIKPDLWHASKFVYTYRDGYIRISLPEDENKYSIKFFTEDNKPLFELNDIKERSFRIDKANFYSAGWFKFELYENGELKEKNKFYLPKEF